jgi:hypothetical protein
MFPSSACRDIQRTRWLQLRTEKDATHAISGPDPCYTGKSISSAYGCGDIGGIRRRIFPVDALRKKIEMNPSEPRYIVTEPWVG